MLAVGLNSNNTFRFRVMALVGVLIGIFVLPYVSIQLYQSPNTLILGIHFKYPDADALMIEHEVTSRFEEAFARLGQLKEIKSVSKEGMGSIELSFEKGAKVEQKRLEIASLVRQIYPDFQDRISFPEVSYVSQLDPTDHLLTYSLVGFDSSFNLDKLITQQLMQPLSKVKGVSRFELNGLERMEWQLVVQERLLPQLGITFEEIEIQLQNYFKTQDLGWLPFTDGNRIYVKYGNTILTDSLRAQVENIALTERNGRIIRVKHIGRLKEIQSTPESYYRINGQAGINLLIYADKAVNQIRLAREIKSKMASLVPAFQEGWGVFLQYNATDFLQKELLKIGFRMALSLIVLFLFIFIIYPRSYLKLIIIGFFISLFWSVIFYFLGGITLHLYSLAGLTLSLGIILDNIIIMADHLAKKKNRKIIIALLAANLTTIGVFIVIILVEDKYREELTGFISIFCINLLMSLITVLWFLPAFHKEKPRNNRRLPRRNRRMNLMIGARRIYAKYILFSQRWKMVIILFLILAFGVPFFILPEKVESRTNFGRLYNQTVGSTFFQENIDPVLDNYLGGTLRLFVNSKIEYLFDSKKQGKTMLQVRGYLPYGSSTQQLNAVMREVESFLMQFPEIDKFQTYVNSYKDGLVEIEFTEDALYQGFPIQLKGKLESKVKDIGSAAFDVSGVGRGFSNFGASGRISQHLRLNGYNYQKLREIAEREKTRLLTHKRIENVLISSQINWVVPDEKYFFLNFQNPDLLLQKGLRLDQIGNKILGLGLRKRQISFLDHRGNQSLIQVISDQTRKNRLWEVQENPILKDSSFFFKIKPYTRIGVMQGQEDIVRSNQEYQLYLEYEFLGPSVLARQYKKEKIKAVQQYLPIGFKIEDEKHNSWITEFRYKVPILIIAAVLIIFFFCSILFNSLEWGLVPLCMIPLSYIGIFLCVYFFKFEFNQGGLAAFLLVAGLSVNGAILIINDYLNLKKGQKRQAPLKLFLRAFDGKIIPIFITSLSTCLGLVPFLIFDNHQAFWYTLSIASISGILFSLLVLILFLPLFFNLQINRA